jgi:hypothetical protein
MAVLTERYRERLLGALSCYDRIVIMGTPGRVLRARNDELSLRARDSHL